jgi:UDP-glucose 4-epimerase
VKQLLAPSVNIESLSSMILVTGASGFVGGALIQSLAIANPQERIVAATRRLLENFPVDVNQVQVGDLLPSTDWRIALQGVNVVVHCAARVHVMNEKSVDPLVEFRGVNVEGTLRLAQQAAEAGVRRFVFISSIKVNGESTELGCPFTPADTPAPLDPYGVSKMEAEQGLRELSVGTGMEVVIIRPPLVYGRGVKANFASMMQWLKRGVPLPLGGITFNRRSLVFVDNLVDLIHICINHPKAANQTFLISDDEDVSTTTLLRKMAKTLGCPARLVNIPPTAINLSARLIGKPGIADRLCGSLQVDISKTKELLGWKPKFSLDEGLLRTAKPTVNACDI